MHLNGKTVKMQFKGKKLAGNRQLDLIIMILNKIGLKGFIFPNPGQYISMCIP